MLDILYAFGVGEKQSYHYLNDCYLPRAQRYLVVCTRYYLDRSHREIKFFACPFAGFVRTTCMYDRKKQYNSV